MNEALPFASKASAIKRGGELLKRHDMLKRYRLTAEPAPASINVHRRRNPSGFARARDSYVAELDRAADKFETFTGFPATKETTFKKRSVRSGFALGELVAVIYAQNRGHGGTQHYEHIFQKNSRPLLVASTDGKQIDIVGGQYHVTERGIEDK